MRDSSLRVTRRGDPVTSNTRSKRANMANAPDQPHWLTILCASPLQSLSVLMYPHYPHMAIHAQSVPQMAV